MKFLTHSNDANASRLWVYNNLAENLQPSSHNPLELVANTNSAPGEEPPLNAQVNAAVSYFSEGVEQNIAANNTQLAKNVSSLAIASQRESSNWQKAGAYNFVAPTELWYLPDAAARQGYNIVKWGNILLDSKGPFSAALQKDLETAINSKQNSPLLYNQLLFHFGKAQFGKTINNAINGENTGVSIFALDIMEQAIGDVNSPAAANTNGAPSNYITEAKKDLADFRTEQQARTKGEETWKKIARMPNPMAWRWPQNLQSKVAENQFATALEQTKLNIASARETQSRRIENTKARIDVFLERAQERGDLDTQRNFWLMVTDVLQNPATFINQRNPNIQGVNWRDKFQCGKGEQGAITFSDTLLKYYAENVVSLPAIQESYHNSLGMIQDVKNQNEALDGEYENLRFDEIRQIMYRSTIEGLAIPSGQDSTDFLTTELSKALGSPPLNINLEREVFRNQDSKIYPSPTWKLNQIMRYLHANPQIITSTNAQERVSLLKSLRYLKGYLEGKYNQLSAELESGGEPTSPQNRYQLLTSFDNLATEAETVINESLAETLAPIMLGTEEDSAQNVSLAINKLERLKTNVLEFKRRLGYGGDNADTLTEEALINNSQFPVAEREVLSMVERLETVANMMKQSATELQAERERFKNEILSIPEADLRDATRGRWESHDDLIAEITRETQGGIPGTPAVIAMIGDAIQNAGEGGAGVTGNLETSLSNLQQVASQYFGKLEEWSTKWNQRAGFVISLPDDTRAVNLPLLQQIHQAVDRAKTDLAFDPEQANERPSINTLVHSDLTKEASDHMRKVSTQLLQSYNHESWQRLKALSQAVPSGVQFDRMSVTDKTNTSKINEVSDIVHSEQITDVTLLPAPKDDQFSGSSIYGECTWDGQKYFFKMVSPRVTSTGDPSNIFFYKKAEGQRTAENQSRPDRKGMVLATSIFNPASRNSPHLNDLWKRSANRAEELYGNVA